MKLVREVEQLELDLAVISHTIHIVRGVPEDEWERDIGYDNREPVMVLYGIYKAKRRLLNSILDPATM